MADPSTSNAWLPVVASILGPVVSSIPTLAGVVVGAWIGYWKESWQRRKRQVSYWAAISAEVDLCAGLARAYVRDNVMAPLYRLPTLAYDKGFPALLGDGAVSEEETHSILRFYAQVVQINRGLEYAHAAAAPSAPEGMLEREVSRLYAKAHALIDPNCDDPGGPYYQRVRAALDKNIKSSRTRVNEEQLYR
jgi:hypothetical protein